MNAVDGPQQMTSLYSESILLGSVTFDDIIFSGLPQSTILGILFSKYPSKLSLEG